MLSGVPELRVRHRLHELVLDAEGRPRLRVLLPPASRTLDAHGPATRASRASTPRTSRRGRCSTSRPATSCARSTSSPSRARASRGSWPRTTSRTRSTCATASVTDDAMRSSPRAPVATDAAGGGMSCGQRQGLRRHRRGVGHRPRARARARAPRRAPRALRRERGRAGRDRRALARRRGPQRAARRGRPRRVVGVRRRGRRALRRRAPDLQQRRHRVLADRAGVRVGRLRARPRREPLGRHPRDQGVPAARRRLRRRPRHQRLEPQRLPRPGRDEPLLRVEVRGARLHRVAARSRCSTAGHRSA